MSVPAYHLRPNKAVDRFLLIEAIRRLEPLNGLGQYTYYSMGGPYLEDFRTVYELCNEISMVSIEKDEQVLERQKFHSPCSTIRFAHMDLFDFIRDYEADEELSIFWLDFTDLRYRNLESFMLLLGKVAEGSVVKITLRAQASDYFKNSDSFVNEFQGLMIAPHSPPPVDGRQFASAIQDIVQVAAQQALPSQLGVLFQPLTSFHYSDGSWMLTVTGVVCSRAQSQSLKDLFESWQFSNLEWANPTRIDVPFLSTKERLHLQDKLPCSDSVGDQLLAKLGYWLDPSEARTKQQLVQYADFHRHYPYFIRGVP